MINKEVERSVLGLIDEVEDITTNSSKDSKQKKHELLLNNFDKTYTNLENEVINQLDDKVMPQKIDKILEELNKVMQDSKSEIARKIDEIYESGEESTYSIIAILNKRVDNLMDNFNDIEKIYKSPEQIDERLEYTKEVLVSEMNKMGHGISEEKKYNIEEIHNKINNMVEDDIKTELSSQIKKIFRTNGITDQNLLDDLEYDTKYILNSNLVNKTLEEFDMIDQNSGKAYGEKVSECFRRVKIDCMRSFEKQMEEEVENLKKSREKKSDTFDLSAFVNDEVETANQTDLREKEEEKIKEDNVKALPADVIW